MIGHVKRQAIKVTKNNILAVAEAAWAKALTLESFGYADISNAVGISLPQATRIVRGWLREGSIEDAGTGLSARLLFRCKPDFVRVEPLRQRSPEENMWTAMRRLRSFTPTDLASHATTETVKVDAKAASDYCRALMDAGFVTIGRQASPALGREAIYRLASVPGVLAPVLRRVRAVVDPNTGRAHIISQIGGIE